MTRFVVHSIPGSPFGRAVLAVLHEKHAPCVFAPVAPQTLKSEAHLARHPFGRVPVLDDGDFRLYETAAIVRYLDRILPTPPLTPTDPKAAARMDQTMNISDWYLFQGVGNVIAFQRVVGPKILGLTPDEGAIAAAMPKAHQVFGELSRLLGDQAYFAGDEASLADFMLGAQLDFFTETPEWAPLTETRVNLSRWLARMNARPSMAATTWAEVAALAA